MKCEFCGKEQNEPKRHYTTIDLDLLRQTPRSVWDEYRENGYTIYEALRMEASYA